MLSVLVWTGPESIKIALRQKCKTGRRLSMPDNRAPLSARYSNGLFLELKGGLTVGTLRNACVSGSEIRLTRERMEASLRLQAVRSQRIK